MRRVVPLLCGVLLLGNCTSAGDPGTSPGPPPGGKADVYGSDDRREGFEAEAVFRQVARSTVLVASSSALFLGANDELRLTSVSYSDRIRAETGAPLCSSEPFRDQPAPGYCSGFLIAPDLVATAGHCINLSYSCEEIRFIFGFAYDASTGEADVTTVPRGDFYRCATVVGHLYDQDATTIDELVSRELWSDWAVVRLDRPVVDRAPLPLRASGKVASGTRVVAVGHPGGLPAKVTSGRVVENAHALYFNTDLDIFAGNSGSVVVDPQGVAEGIVIRGSGGKSFEVAEGCSRARRCSSYDPAAGSDCTGNHVMRVAALQQFTGASRLVTAAAAVSGAAAVIPDGTGEVVVDLAVTDPGLIRFATLNLELSHAHPADLEIALERGGDQRVVLFNRPKLTRAGWSTYSRTTGDFAGQTAAGAWRVRVRDLVANGSGLQSVQRAELVLGIGAAPVPAPGATFIGTRCAGDADCSFSAAATCHRYPDGATERGFCTVPCAGYCPDLAGFAPTFCTSLDGGGAGRCVPRAHALNQSCATLPGTSPREVARFLGDSGAAAATATVCLP